MIAKKSNAGRSPSDFPDEGWNRGLFTDQSIIRRIGRESLTLLGGGRAVLLQVAHPLVAAGVAEHSSFQSDPMVRLYGTLELMHQLVFGSEASVENALRRFRVMHSQVRGQLVESAGVYAEQTTYAGDDPELKLWVFATLVDTSLMSYQRFVAPLTEHQHHRYYQEALILAKVMAIPAEILPPDYSTFTAYIDEMLTGPKLAVTDTARDLAWSVLDPPVTGPQYASARLLRFVTAGMLPSHLRQAFNLPWNSRRQMVLDALSWTTRRLRPLAPAWLWRSPLHAETSFLRTLLWPGDWPSG
ncbi:MAG: oxygenase MpaB family protein [Anaerolineales bacterium]